MTQQNQREILSRSGKTETYHGLKISVCNFSILSAGDFGNIAPWINTLHGKGKKGFSWCNEGYQSALK